MIIQIDKKQLEGLIGKLEKFGDKIISKNLTELLVVQLKNSIKLRTYSGKDKDNRAFKPYSASYAKKTGKKRVNLTSSLKGSPGMLIQMTQKVLSNTTAKIFFNNLSYANGATVNEVVRSHLEGLGRLPIRDFFGVDDTDMKDMQKTYIETVEKTKKELKL